MADIDEKTQKLIDRAVKQQRAADKKAVTEAFKDATTASKDLEDKGQKKAVGDALKELKSTVTDVFVAD